MAWNEEQIAQHIKAASLLGKIKDEAFDLMGHNPNVSEYEVQQFVMSMFSDHGLVLEGKLSKVIVAFGGNTRFCHYFPSKSKARRLKGNTLIMLDIYGRLKKRGAPYADITWMAYKGSRIPKEVESAFKCVVDARDTALKVMKLGLAYGRLPRGDEIDSIAQGVLTVGGYEKGIEHAIGHPLGTCSAHGKAKGIDHDNFCNLESNLGYTIEPGLYFKNFGVRSEIDFYITRNKELVVTTGLQKKIVKI